MPADSVPDDPHPTPAALTPGDTVALTGGTGFLGGHLITALLGAGLKIRALTRRPQPARDGIDWLDGSMEDPAALTELIRGSDGLVHAAGLVKAKRKLDFLAVNAGGTTRLALAAATEKEPLSRAILISSIVARTPQLSPYATSKRAAENIWETLPEPIGWAILRPPAIYGPGDEEVLKLLRAGKQGTLPNPGGRFARFSLIHAADVARAVVALLTGPTLPDSILELGDGQPDGYGMADVADTLETLLGARPRVVSVAPPVVKAAAVANQLMAAVTGRTAFFTLAKAREVTHPDWVAAADRGGPPVPGFVPAISLEQGLRETLDWAEAAGKF